MTESTRVADGVDEGSGNDPSDVGSTCARVAAVQFLAGELVTDQFDIELVSLRQVDWPDSSLGCAEEGRFYIAGVVPGYEIFFDYQGTSHEIHTNRFGSRMVTCTTGQQPESESPSP